MKKNSLGRGLDSLFMNTGEAQIGQIAQIDINNILPDPEQHRKTFDEDTIAELAESIKIHGIIQPLVARDVGDGKYVLIAGERRYRASKLAGLEKLPVIVKDVSPKDAAEMALIENLQREDLNPIDEAMGFKRLIEEFGITQENAAGRVGKSRVSVTNTMRLLALPEKVIEMLRKGVISAGHGRALLPLKDNEEELFELCARIIDEGLSVRDTEAEVRFVLNYTSPEETAQRQAPSKKEATVFSEYIRSVEKTVTERLGRRVKIKVKEGKSAGKMTIDYIDTADLEEILSKLCGDDIIEKLDN